MDNIASALEVSPASVRYRATRMRKAGVRLPVQRKGKKYDVKSLNNIIKEWRNRAK